MKQVFPDFSIEVQYSFKVKAFGSPPVEVMEAVPIITPVAPTFLTVTCCVKLPSLENTLGKLAGDGEAVKGTSTQNVAPGAVVVSPAGHWVSFACPEVAT